MTLKRHWWLVKENGEGDTSVYVYVTATGKKNNSGDRRRGVRLTKSGRAKGDSDVKEPVSAVRKVVVDTNSKNSLGHNGIKFFFEGYKHTFFRQEFEWHQNDFCRNFRDITLAVDFVSKFNELVDKDNASQEDTSVADESMQSAYSQSDSTSDDVNTSSDTGSSSECHSQSPEVAYSQKDNARCPGGKSQKKRLSSDELTVPDLKKKKRRNHKDSSVKSAEDAMTEIVNDHAIPGLFGIHTCNLKLGKQVRKVDDYFVQTLVDSMEKFTDESYSPYVVMVDVKKITSTRITLTDTNTPYLVVSIITQPQSNLLKSTKTGNYSSHGSAKYTVL
ncbi:uncharacterized protein [Ptychodera flava]|uniref:uncharacterized protein n=1 Tax=Ptychodera flava TaxID=63121 RepID=UPI00396A6528